MDNPNDNQPSNCIDLTNELSEDLPKTTTPTTFAALQETEDNCVQNNLPSTSTGISHPLRLTRSKSLPNLTELNSHRMEQPRQQEEQNQTQRLDHQPGQSDQQQQNLQEEQRNARNWDAFRVLFESLLTRAVQQNELQPGGQANRNMNSNKQRRQQPKKKRRLTRRERHLQQQRQLQKEEQQLAQERELILQRRNQWLALERQRQQEHEQHLQRQRQQQQLLRQQLQMQYEQQQLQQQQEQQQQSSFNAQEHQQIPQYYKSIHALHHLNYLKQYYKDINTRLEQVRQFALESILQQQNYQLLQLNTLQETQQRLPTFFFPQVLRANYMQLQASCHQYYLQYQQYASLIQKVLQLIRDDKLRLNINNTAYNLADYERHLNTLYSELRGRQRAYERRASSIQRDRVTVNFNFEDESHNNNSSTLGTLFLQRQQPQPQPQPQQQHQQQQNSGTEIQAQMRSQMYRYDNNQYLPQSQHNGQEQSLESEELPTTSRNRQEQQTTQDFFMQHQQNQETATLSMETHNNRNMQIRSRAQNASSTLLTFPSSSFSSPTIRQTTEIQIRPEPPMRMPVITPSPVRYLDELQLQGKHK